MPRTALFLLMVMFSRFCFSQETKVETHKLSGGSVETYHVLKSNDKIKQGAYLIATKKNVAIAIGSYTEGKRIGRWNFCDKTGKINEVFNYNTNQLLYEARPDSLNDCISYIFDQKTSAKDTVTKPIRIGGIYFGYMPYVKYFKIDALTDYPLWAINAFLQLLVSPNGNLAECKLVLKLKQNDVLLDSYLLDTALVDDYEKQFLPATINHKAVTATISVLVKINSNFTISLY